MQTATTRWLLALTLALALAAPGLARSEVPRRAGFTQPEQFESPPIQVIRRIKVGGAYPVAEGVKTGSKKQGAAKNKNKSKSKAKANSKSNRGIKIRPLKVRSFPIRSLPIRATAVRSPSIRSNVIRSTPIRSFPIRVNTGRA